MELARQLSNLSALVPPSATRPCSNRRLSMPQRSRPTKRGPALLTQPQWCSQTPHASPAKPATHLFASTGIPARFSWPDAVEELSAKCDGQGGRLPRGESEHDPLGRSGSRASPANPTYCDLV